MAELLFVTPTLMEGYLTAARKISRVAVGDPSLPLIVDTYRLPLGAPAGRSARRPAFRHARRRRCIRDYFPLDGDYVINLELSGAAREPHQLEVSLDGQRVKLFSVGGPPSSRPGEPSGNEDDGEAALQVRVPGACRLSHRGGDLREEDLRRKRSARSAVSPRARAATLGCRHYDRRSL